MRKALVSAGGLGYLPIAPGTWGSLAGVGIFLLAGLSGWPFLTALICLGGVVVFSALTVGLGDWAYCHYGSKDPSPVVIDEVAGYLVAVLFLPIDGANLYYSAGCAFFVFRIFDIIKPTPARQFERFRGGWGILADDLMAGVYANLLCQCIMITIVPALLGVELPESLGLGQAGLLGVVQGLGEFLPISSSGHLALGQNFLNLTPDSSEMMLFDLAIHVATLGAVLVVFFRPVKRMVQSIVRGLGKYGVSVRLLKESPDLRLLWLGFLACIPTGLVYVIFSDRIEAFFAEPVVIGCCFMVTGLVILLAERLGRPRRGLREFAIWAALIIGLAQGLALMPGISRSGMTICVALLCGIRRGWAGRFSFLIAAPAILAGFALHLLKVLGQVEASSVPWSAILLGSVVAFCVGLWALRVLLKGLHRSRLSYFTIYLWIVGPAVIVGQLFF